MHRAVESRRFQRNGDARLTLRQQCDRASTGLAPSLSLSLSLSLPLSLSLSRRLFSRSVLAISSSLALRSFCGLETLSGRSTQTLPVCRKLAATEAWWSVLLPSALLRLPLSCSLARARECRTDAEHRRFKDGV